MADMPNPPTNGPGSGDGSGLGPPQQQQPALAVKAQYVKDLSFENPRAPQSLAQQISPEIRIAINVGLQPLSGNDYEVTLTINAEAKMAAEALFTVELVYAGVFAVGPIPTEHVRPVLLIEGPRLLFPFARNIIADSVRDGGFPPLFLQPVDFYELYRREVASQQARANPPPPSSPLPQ